MPRARNQHVTMTTKPRKTTPTPRTRRAPRAAAPAAAPPPPAPALPRVRLTCQAPGARAVFVAGTFNQWHPTATPLQPAGEHLWAVELELPPGVYEYRFIVDGCWQHDPAAAQQAPNPFGSLNSVLTVTDA